MKGCVFGAGAYHGEWLSMTEGAYIVAADGGYRHTEAYALTPSLVVGDFDSMEAPSVSSLKRYPVKKDDTDMALAVEEALAHGCDELFLFGGMGGRPDHTLANLSLLLSLKARSVSAYLVGEEGVFTAMIGGEGLRFDASCRGTLSLFAASDQAYGVTIRGLLYPLQRYTLTKERALGVSNSFLSEQAEISLEKGALLVFWENTHNQRPTLFTLTERYNIE